MMMFHAITSLSSARDADLSIIQRYQATRHHQRK